MALQGKRRRRPRSPLEYNEVFKVRARELLPRSGSRRNHTFFVLVFITVQQVFVAF